MQTGSFLLSLFLLAFSEPFACVHPYNFILVYGSRFSSRVIRVNKKESRVRLSFLLVRMTGLEPAQPCDHKNLNLTRLPVPPHPHVSRYILSYLLRFATDIEVICKKIFIISSFYIAKNSLFCHSKGLYCKKTMRI